MGTLYKLDAILHILHDDYTVINVKYNKNRIIICVESWTKQSNQLDILKRKSHVVVERKEYYTETDVFDIRYELRKKIEGSN